MRRLSLAFAVLALATGPCARAGDMTLTKDGTLYRLASDGQQLVLTATAVDGSTTVMPVPQTTGDDARELQVAVDGATGVVVAVWQEGTGDLAQVELATLTAGTWQGPEVVAGSVGAPAANPALLVHRVATVVEEEDGPQVYATTVAHLAWWQGLDTPTRGEAWYAAVPLEDDGRFDLMEAAPVALRDLIPFGFNCNAIADPANLAYPRLFVDPGTGDPHVMAVDLPSCLFQIVQLRPELGDPDPVTKRRRHTIIFGYNEMIAANAALPLSTAKVEVGHGLSVVLYWDGPTAISYTLLRAEGWSEVRALPLGAGLDRDRAVELIRGLAQ